MTKPKSNRKRGTNSSSREIIADRPWWRSPSLSINWNAVLRLLITLCSISLAYRSWIWLRPSLDVPSTQDNGACPQANGLTPSRNADIWHDLNRILRTDQFKYNAIESLQRAVRIRTDAFDNMGPVGDDPRWDVFDDFRQYLQNRFRLVHSNLELTLVNTHGLFYQWKGEDPTLKPILLAAHQDVVPVDESTWGLWTHPPYDAHFDSTRIWGRGSSDDKSQLVAILTAVESLLERGFRPTRTILLAFGFDEEASGFHGAQYLADHIKSVYGHDGVAMIVDEGAGFYDLAGVMLAIPGITEKGMYNVRVEVSGPGGHSSMASKHTTIGFLSKILGRLEDHPFPSHLAVDHPAYSIAQCLIPNAKILPRPLRPLLQLGSRLLRFQVVRDVAAWWFRDAAIVRSLVPTTQAIDMIRGGVKSNALPENAWALVNHRVSVTSSLGEVQERYIRLVKPFAKKYNMTFEAFDRRVYEGSSPYSVLISNATLHGVEPAPFTPTGRKDLPFQILSGTIKSTYKAHRNITKGADVVVAPGMMTGNTDTKYYWNLSKHIFRYNHHYGGKKPDPSANGIHTVNEFIEADVLLESVRFFITLILNADESDM